MARDPKTRSLRQRIADWPPLTNAVGRVLAGWLRLVRATSSWTEDGKEEMIEAINREGAAVLLVWHERTIMTPYSFDISRTPVRSINAASRAGLLARATLHRFGYETSGMRSGKAGLGAMRQVLTDLSNGISTGMAVDGPRGPARKAKSFPIQWARSSGKPVYIFAYSARNHIRWPSWDRMMLPMPFTRVALIWRRWDAEIPRRPSEEQMATLLNDLNAAIDAVTNEADERVAGNGNVRD